MAAGVRRALLSMRCAYHLFATAPTQHAMPCDAVRCHATPCDTMLCHALPHPAAGDSQGPADTSASGGTTLRAQSAATAAAQPAAAALGNADAARAVLRVKQKLEGAAGGGGGDGGPLSPAAQVDALLAQAQDPERLCRMFAGWSPWM